MYVGALHPVLMELIFILRLRLCGSKLLHKLLCKMMGSKLAGRLVGDANRDATERLA